MHPCMGIELEHYKRPDYIKGKTARTHADSRFLDLAKPA